MKSIAIGWPGAVVGNILVIALFVYRDTPAMWDSIAVLLAVQGVLTLGVLLLKRRVAADSWSGHFVARNSKCSTQESLAEAPLLSE